jgi:hypothetical protein
MDSNNSITWSASLNATTSSHIHLSGDKILLPPSALSDLLAASPLTDVDGNPPDSVLTDHFDPFNPHTYAAELHARRIQQSQRDKQQQLPQPLTFRLVNPGNARVIYAGIREFSADEGEVVLSAAICHALGLEFGPESGAKHQISVIAKQLPKGTFVKLRPLEAGYDADDWKALLEQHLRSNYTTLTKGDVLNVPSPSGDFKLLVDELTPDSDAVCVVDTDLEVAIEALNEEQARETVKIIATKANLAPGSADGSSPGGAVDLFSEVEGQVLDNEYVDYTLASWARGQGVEIVLNAIDHEIEIDLYVSTFSTRQRANPRNGSYQFAAYEGSYPRKVVIPPSNSDLEEAESIRISIYAYSSATSSPSPRKYQLSIAPYDPSTPTTSTETSHSINPEEVQCQNCLQFVPKRTLILHENFCLRNNIRCPHCSLVFLKSSPAWQNHWHCPHDASFGSAAESKIKHDLYAHTPTSCPACHESTSSLIALAHHRTTDCSQKLILCRFCHLQVAQGDPDPTAALQGLTPHELADGARTTECHFCGRIVRLREMDAHLKHHEFSKATRLSPRICANEICGYTVDGVDAKGNTRLRKDDDEKIGLGLCPRCAGPLYVALYDPEGNALRGRIERRYLTQLIKGCGKPWCANDMCKTGRKNQGLPDLAKNIKEAMPLLQPIVKALKEHRPAEDPVQLKFCVDEKSQASRALAGMLAAEGVYGMDWCVGATEFGETEGRAREWLGNWSPKKS